MAHYNGYKNSGCGREIILTVMHELTQEKSIWIIVDNACLERPIRVAGILLTALS